MKMRKKRKFSANAAYHIYDANTT